MKKVITAASSPLPSPWGRHRCGSGAACWRRIGRPAGGYRVPAAGIATLKSLGLLSAVASGIEVVGVGQVAYQTVLSLHRTSPELFQTGGVSVVVPGVGAVAATWCDGV